MVHSIECYQCYRRTPPSFFFPSFLQHKRRLCRQCTRMKRRRDASAPLVRILRSARRTERRMPDRGHLSLEDVEFLVKQVKRRMIFGWLFLFYLSLTYRYSKASHHCPGKLLDPGNTNPYPCDSFDGERTSRYHGTMRCC